ncbi:hypothetical protein E4P48_10905, partial [Porphyromonas levii]
MNKLTERVLCVGVSGLILFSVAALVQGTKKCYANPVRNRAASRVKPYADSFKEFTNIDEARAWG